MSLHEKGNKNLGLFELVAIALGGIVGGGIFTILGISVSIIGILIPLAILIGNYLLLQKTNICPIYYPERKKYSCLCGCNNGVYILFFNINRWIRIDFGIW